MKRRPKNLRQAEWNAVEANYADLKNPEWLLNDRLPQKFWADPHNHRRYVTWISSELNIEHLDDWYQVSRSEFSNRRGERLLEYYGHSHINFIMAMYPSHDWIVWKFRQVPNRFWADVENVKAYVKWFEKQIGICKKSDWYRIQQRDFENHCGGGLISNFQGSVVHLLRTVYSKDEWKPWLFCQVTKNFWIDRVCRVEYLQWLEKQLGYKSPEDWYQVTNSDFARNHGASLLITMGQDRTDFLAELYPNFRWQEWKFKQVKPGFWDDRANRIEYLRWLGKQLGYQRREDWYAIRARDFENNFGATLIYHFYDGDLLSPLKELFPRSNWHPWRFTQVPNGFWDTKENCQEYLSWLAKKLGYKKKEDWYRVSRNEFWANCGSGFYRKFRTPYKGLSFAYPDYEWLPWLFDYAPSGFWNDSENRIRYLKWLGQQLDLSKPQDWHQIKTSQITEHKGGIGLLSKLTTNQIREEGKVACAMQYSKRHS